MVKMALDPLEAYRADLARYKLLTLEEEQLYTRKIRGTVLQHPKIRIASDILFLDEDCDFDRERFKAFDLNNETTLVDLKTRAREFLEKFNSKEDHAKSIEDWLLDRDRKRFGEFSEIDRYNASKRAMVTGNLRMAYKFASDARYSGATNSLIDLIQIANIGLDRALLRFDPERGVKFMTYAGLLIKQYLSRYKDKSNVGIRFPCQAFEDYITIRNLIGNHSDSGRFSRKEIEEIAINKGGIPSSRVGNVLPFVFGKDFSRGPYDFGDLEIAEGNVGILENLETKDRKLIARELLGVLTPDESRIINAYYGVGEPDGEFTKDPTLKEIGEVIGLSRSRIGQIVEIALKKMRNFIKLKYPDHVPD